MIEEAEPPSLEEAKAWFRDAPLLAGVLRKNPGLVSSLVKNPGFRESLLMRQDLLKALVQADAAVPPDPLVRAVGGDGAMEQGRPNRDRDEAGLRQLLIDEDAAEKGKPTTLTDVFTLPKQPREPGELEKLVEAVVENPAFIEALKRRRPHVYRSLLDQAQQRYADSKDDPALLHEIEREQRRLKQRGASMFP